MKRAAWGVVAGLVTVGAAWSLDPPRSVQAPPPAPAQEAPQPEASKAEEPKPAAESQDAPDEEETLPPPPPDERPTGPTPQRFDPSEEVRADFPVSFPIDI